MANQQWHCSQQCAGTIDHKQRHSEAILMEGLKLLAVKDALRLGDGEAIIGFWRMDMPQFFANNHTNYLAAGHRLLAGTYQLLNYFPTQFVIVLAC